MSDATSVELHTSSLFNVSGQVALVTGGGSGIGLMIATTLVANGCRVYISSRKEKILKECADRLNRMGPGECHHFAADLSSRAGCDALATHIKSRESRLHILVNNSGASWGGPWDDFPETQGWDKIMALNVKALFYLTAALTDVLSSKAGATNVSPGRVINISSVTSTDPKVEMGAIAGEGMGAWSYVTSKAAVNHLTSIQAVALAPKNVTVNAILPGLFPSRMTAAGIEVYGDEYRAHQPTGRYGQASDVGGTVLFLASSAGSHVTGALIPLDGGATISGNSGFQINTSESKDKLYKKPTAKL